MFGNNNDPLSLNQTPAAVAAANGRFTSVEPPAPPPPVEAVVPGVGGIGTTPTGINAADGIGGIVPDAAVGLPGISYTPPDNEPAEEYMSGPFDAPKKPEEPETAIPVIEPANEATAPAPVVTETTPPPATELTTKASAPAPVVAQALPATQEDLKNVLDTVKEGLDKLNAGIQGQTAKLQEINKTLKIIAAPEPKSVKVVEAPQAPTKSEPEATQPAASAEGPVEGYSFGPAKPAAPAVPSAHSSPSDAPTNRII